MPTGLFSQRCRRREARIQWNVLWICVLRIHKKRQTRQTTVWKQDETNFQSALDAYRAVFSTFQTQERVMNLRIALVHEKRQTQQHAF